MECPDLGLLVFEDCTQLVAIGAGGIAWTTERIAWDGIHGLTRAGQQLAGEAWCAVDDQSLHAVDLRTGAVEGGSYFAHRSDNAESGANVGEPPPNKGMKLPRSYLCGWLPCADGGPAS